MAKQMGLHEKGIIANDPQPEDIEKQNILWILYSIDKQRVFIRGPPCRIYLFECRIHLPHSKGNNQQLITTNLRLSCLVEDVYMDLYAPKSRRKDAKGFQKRASRLESRLRNLVRQSSNTLASAERGLHAEMTLGLQLRYAFYVTKLLILTKVTDERNQQLRLETARNALQIIQKLLDGSNIYNGCMSVLER